MSEQVTVVSTDELADWFIERWSVHSNERGLVVGVLKALRVDRDALRAVLAPLLDDPLIGNRCRCCKREVAAWDRAEAAFIRKPHAPDCAVLRRDELLGR